MATAIYINAKYMGPSELESTTSVPIGALRRVLQRDHHRYGDVGTGGPAEPAWAEAAWGILRGGGGGAPVGSYPPGDQKCDRPWGCGVPRAAHVPTNGAVQRAHAGRARQGAQPGIYSLSACD
eukprot:7588059-Pyramimonas_sp.AAC.1